MSEHRLSDRLRPEVEAAPWVINEIRKLEGELAAIKSDKDFWEKASETGAKNRMHDYIMRLSAEVSENKKLRSELEVLRKQKPTIPEELSPDQAPVVYLCSVIQSVAYSEGWNDCRETMLAETQEERNKKLQAELEVLMNAIGEQQ